MSGLLGLALAFLIVAVLAAFLAIAMTTDADPFDSDSGDDDYLISGRLDRLSRLVNNCRSCYGKGWWEDDDTGLERVCPKCDGTGVRA